MEGITILNQFVVDNAPVGWLAAVAGAVLLCVCFWAFISFIGWREYGYSIAFVILGIICSGLIVSGVTITNTPPETRYQVLIDESVSMSEFFEKYEIIEQEGKIYTVKEKEQ